MKKRDKTKEEGGVRYECPRAGIAYLKPDWKSIVVLPTICKAWSCRACQKKKLSVVVDIISGGLDSREWYLVSVTYVGLGRAPAPVVNPVSAKRAEKDWKGFLRLLEQESGLGKMTWLQVIELTKRKQLHRHILMQWADIGSRTVDCGQWDYQLRRDGECSCVTCYLCRLWYRVTGDSYVVDCTYVYSHGVAGYLAKYLQKGMYGEDRQILAERGIKRLWSTSRNWSRRGLMMRRGTVEKAWVDHSFKYGNNSLDRYMIKSTKDHPMLEQVGSPMAHKMVIAKRGARYAISDEKIRRGGRSGGG